MDFLPEQTQHINNFLSVSAGYLGLDASVDRPGRTMSASLTGSRYKGAVKSCQTDKISQTILSLPDNPHNHFCC